LAIFQKTMILKRQDAYDNYQEESTRVETDFVINTAKNVAKNYRLKTSNCYSELIIKPNSDYEYITIQPNDGDDGTPFTTADPLFRDVNAFWYEYLYVDPDLTKAICDPARQPEQVPFVLGARGILFRNRSTPYFTTMSNPKGYIE